MLGLIGQSLDANVLSGAAGNDLKVLAAKNNSRTAYIWHQSNSELAAVAWMSYVFQADPDEQSTNWAYKPLSGISLKDPRITSTQQGNIESDNGNVVLAFGGNAVAGMGVTTTGGKIDVLITEDWLRARLEEDFIQLLSDVSARNEKISLTDRELQLIPSTGQGRLDQGVRVEHLAEGTTFISITKRADMPSADVTARLIRVTAGGTAANAAEKIVATFTLALT